MKRVPAYNSLLILLLCGFGFSAPALAADPPTAVILSPDTSWCEASSNLSQASIELIGAEAGTTFDLHLSVRGRLDTLENLPAGIFTIYLQNVVGENLYIVREIIEHQQFADVLNPVHDSLLVRVHPLPEVSYQTSYEDLCSPAAVNFLATEGYASYWWDLGDGNWQEGSESVFKVFNNDGADLVVSYLTGLKIASAQGCLDSSGRQLDIHITPEPSFTVNTDFLYYPDTTVEVTNTTIGSWDYAWIYGDSIDTPSGNPYTLHLDSWGMHEVLLRASSEHCRDSVSQQVTVYPGEPVAVISSDIIEGCGETLTVRFSAEQSEFSTSYYWEFGDEVGNSPEKNPVYTYQDPGSYEVSLRATGPAGIDYDQIQIEVFDPPTAGFGVDSRYLTPGEEVQFNNNSIGADTIAWDFGDGGSSRETDPLYIYDDTGTYTITQIVSSKDGCNDTLVREDLIIVEPGKEEALFPTAFCWNQSGPTNGIWEKGDDNNTIFHPHADNVASGGFHMVVLNRRGVKIWESTDFNTGWEGYSSFGELAPWGVYVYQVRILYENGEEKTYMGDVTFLHNCILTD